MSLAQHHEQYVTLKSGDRFCYAEHGVGNTDTIVLIVGLGLQLVYWPNALIERLVASGFRVICFDNRDAGRSVRSDTPHPSLLQQLRGRSPKGAYGLERMAEDTAELLEALNITSAHIAGMSMGGMIAQTLASLHPEKVTSMTSIFSTTGSRKVGQPSYSTLWRLARAKAPTSEKDAVKNYQAMMTHIGDVAAKGAVNQWHQYARLAWQRNGGKSDAKAMFRQIGAIMKSGDRTPMLQNVKAPTLVIHGDVDRMVHPSGGVATARAISGAKHQVLRGLRHQIDTVQSHRIADSILAHIHLNANK
ncbi:alpha/beta hydrolase [Alteromonas marina]|jgi:pimeloyl-ACP methyl ester carboxylesterase|uniref:Alpha/beta hydrolase n=1 Tax=Alteromonas marina TaxID=203795 RepID=A0A0B3YAH7_9ALTE|nr:alpha/beta hydrolase [Alteromonas marina]KHT54063.1 alpha/beta hydrolase [Alteromonas marina]